MKGIRGGLAACLLAAALLQAVSAGPMAAETLRIGGTGGAIGGIARLARSFQEQHPEVGVEILGPMGSTGAIRAAIVGKLDIALSSRPLTPEERGRGGQETPYARTPFVFAAHRDVPVSGITLSEVVEIFRGRTGHWKDGTKVRPVLRSLSDTDAIELERVSPELEAAYEYAHRREGMIVARTEKECADRIEKTPGAFGTTTLSLVVSENRRIKVLPVAGVAPSAGSVRDGSYPYTKTFRLVTRPSRSIAVARFKRFLRTPGAMSILLETGHVELP